MHEREHRALAFGARGVDGRDAPEALVVQRHGGVVFEQGNQRGDEGVAGLLPAHLAQALHQRERVERVGDAPILVARARVLAEDGEPAQPDDDTASLETAGAGKNSADEQVAPRRRRSAPSNLPEEHDELD